MKRLVKVFAKRLILLTADLSLVILTLPLALYLRLESDQLSTMIQLLFPKYYVLGAVSYFVSFMFFKPYRTILRLANLFTALRVALAIVAGGILFYLASVAIPQLQPIPRSAYIIQILLLVPSCLGVRFSFRIIERLIHYPSSTGEPTLIYGAGLTTDRVLPMLLRAREQYRVLGILDDDAAKKGSEVQGIRVIGSGKDIDRLVEKFGITHIILSMPSISGDALRKIIKRLYKLELVVKTLPSPEAYFNNSSNGVVNIRDIDIEDLLRRNPRKLDRGAIANLIQNKVVLVTGAGGSIGSELARQIAGFEPKLLILNDSSEFALYTIVEEFNAKFPDLKTEPYLANMTDPNLCNTVFAQYPVDIVFHACAYKHVPLLEKNVISGVRNNLESAENVFLAAREHGVKKVVLISSDKAVRPTNVMGATKRVCELLALWHSQQASTTCSFTCVRFGNVLGSSGSVLPKFIEQVHRGGPITITHPDITRYFMLIPEAVSLVLQAATAEDAFGNFLLNMGEPIKIVDMARDLLQLMGKQIDKDVRIAFTGLRPGEKLHEELHLDCEDLMSINEDYSKITTRVELKPDFRDCIALIAKYCQQNNEDGVKEELFKLIASYEGMRTPKKTALETERDLELDLAAIQALNTNATGFQRVAETLSDAALHPQNI